MSKQGTKKEARKMDLLLDQLCWMKVTTTG
jgi:hypothetical protein